MLPRNKNWPRATRSGHTEPAGPNLKHKRLDRDLKAPPPQRRSWPLFRNTPGWHTTPGVSWPWRWRSARVPQPHGADCCRRPQPYVDSMGLRGLQWRGGRGRGERPRARSPHTHANSPCSGRRRPAGGAAAAVSACARAGGRGRGHPPAARLRAPPAARPHCDAGRTRLHDPNPKQCLEGVLGCLA